MAELSLKERLQPALLDRLLDDARFVSRYRISVPTAELTRLGLPAKDFLAILLARGLKVENEDDDPLSGSSESGDAAQLVIKLVAAGAAVSPGQLKALTITPPGAPHGVTLESFCAIDSAASLNIQPEPAEKRMISMRRLRELVERDLGWLLNSSSLDSIDDLTPYPEVARSVVNYGMPSFAGAAVHAVDPQATARQIREAIERFEPRLGRVQVTPEMETDHRETTTLSFRIEGEIWGQPMSQHVVLQTRIDVETGDVRIGDAPTS